MEMRELNTRRIKSWDIHSSSSSSYPNPSPSPPLQTDVVINKDLGPWKSSNSFGASTSAISFGFVATAILISMFLIMAIFEHLFSPDSDSRDDDRDHDHQMESSRHTQKLASPDVVQASHALDFSVVMPGQQCPTFIARPAPLPCPREGAFWPSHQRSLAQP